MITQQIRDAYRRLGNKVAESNDKVFTALTPHTVYAGNDGNVNEYI